MAQLGRRPFKDPSTRKEKRIIVYLSNSLYKRLQEYAKRERRTEEGNSVIARNIIDRFLDSEGI